MSLVPFWYIVIAILWTGFFILEGFDFGVGMLHALAGRDEAGRRAAINTIGPLWDGNEVWLIVAAAGMFAAFPGWYATMFSQPGLQPHRAQHRLRRLLPQDHDRRRDHLPAPGPGLPGLDLLRLPPPRQPRGIRPGRPA
jgi:hypothetical protein